jgi:hypothetical protein
MFGLVLIEMVHAADQERMRQASIARESAQARRERRRLARPGRTMPA